MKAVLLMANNKKRILTFEVYPDNPEQVNAFEWLKTSRTCSGMYILHKAEGEEKKDHIHVMVRLENPVNCKVIDGQLVCESYAKSFGTFDGYQSDTGFLYRCKGDTLPDGAEWKSYPVFSMVQGVSDAQSLAHYFLHERYVDIRQSKIRYEFSDLCFFGDDSFFLKLFDISANNAISELSELVTAFSDSREKCMDIIRYLIFENRPDLLEYIRKNPYFVKTFLMK